ncbi:hypothetical protein ABD89_17045 [Lysinibacillus sphaericus]|nr:hypothetical protein [Lysinibacillus sphaericus]MBG9757015.1 hypothetical protein [Lysinibacillus sphaericus]
MTIAEEWQELRNNFNPSQPITVNRMHIFKEQLKNEPQTQEILRILVEVYCFTKDVSRSVSTIYCYYE